MSFHKLKIGQRKQKSFSKSQNSNEKGKERELFGFNVSEKMQFNVSEKKQLNMNDKVQLNMNQKIQSVNSDHKMISTRKPNNIISISDDFPQDMLKFKKPEQNMSSKTERVHKIERLDFSITNNQADRTYNHLQRELHQPNIEGEYSTASSVINFLSVQKGDNGKRIDDRLESMKGKELRKDNKIEKEASNQVTEDNQNYYCNNLNKTSNSQQKVEIISKIIDKKEIDISPSKQHYVKYKVNMTMRNDNKKDDKETHEDNYRQPSSDNVNKPTVSNSISLSEPKLLSLQESVSHKETEGGNGQQKQQQLLVQNKRGQLKEVMDSVQNTKEERIYSQSLQLIIKPNIDDFSYSDNMQANVSTPDKPTAQPSQPVKQHTSQLFQSPVRKHLPMSTQQFANIQSPTRSIISYKPINQIEMTILHQNKTLQQQVQRLRKQRDQLQFKSKRQQIQLLQSNNTQYYTRQIARLRGQVQNLQSSNQQLKHQNFMLQNKNKQVQSTLQIKIKQLRKMIQQLEKVKIDSTKEKFQLKDKSNQLAMIVKQMQERNKEMSEKFQLYYSKAQEVEARNKLLLQEVNNSMSIIKQLQTKLANQQRMNKDKHRILENQVAQLSIQKQQIQNKFRQSQRLYQSQTQTLKQSLKQLTLKRQSQALLMSTRAMSLQKHNTSIHTQMQVVKLQQELKQLQDEVIKRSQLIKQLNKKIDSMISMSDYEELRIECERINHQKVKEKQQYQRKISQLEGRMIGLSDDGQRRTQKQQEQSVMNSTSQGTFKQLLKLQILQQDQLKQQLFNKQQVIHQLKQELQDEIIKYQGIKNDHEILKKQFTSFQNNSKVKKEIVQQELNNQIQTLKRKHTLLEKKLQSKIKQNQQKEVFIQTYIVGNNKSNDSQYLLKQIQRIFLQKQKKQLQ